MILGVIGCGNVGFAFLSWLQKQHHTVLGLDTSIAVRNKIQEELGQECLALSYADLAKCQAVFICVPTEPTDNGSADMSIYETVINSLRKVAFEQESVAVIQRSTCPPGSAKIYAKMLGENISYAVHPSFLRKSSIEFDTENPDRIAIGGKGFALNLLTSIYQNVRAPRFISESYETAELLKYIENTLDAMLISYWNSILEYAVKIGIGTDELILLIEHIGDRDKFKSLARIPGKAFGLWCLPKDLSALIHEFQRQGIDPVLFCAISDINQKIEKTAGIGIIPAQELIKFKNSEAIVQDKGYQQIDEYYELKNKTGVTSANIT